jgi:hypothetical protein
MLLRNVGVPLLFACTLLAAGCANPTVHRAVPMDPIPPSMASQPGDRQVLAGEWDYVDGAVVRLVLDEQGNGHYDWKDGRFETLTLIGHTWHGRWFQKENDRDGGFTVEFSPDSSEGEGRWWVSRIETDHASTQKGGTFHLSKRLLLYPTAILHRHREKLLAPWLMIGRGPRGRT